MEANRLLNVKGLRVSVDDKEILKGIDLKIAEGEVHVIMGPNGSGKSTLAYALMGHPKFKVTSGAVTLKVVDKGKRSRAADLLEMNVTQRARRGVFLGFQNPIAVDGVSVLSFLWRMRGVLSQTQEKNYVGRDGSSDQLHSTVLGIQSMKKFKEELTEYCGRLSLAEEFLKRNLNEGFSGGERKKLEVLQMLVFRPRVAIFDEIDSGTDVDALKKLGVVIQDYLKRERRSSVIIITHYNRILTYLKPDWVHIFNEGMIVKSGSVGLAREVEKRGYIDFQTHYE